MFKTVAIFCVNDTSQISLRESDGKGGAALQAGNECCTVHNQVNIALRLGFEI